jgi:hypothetical protein
LLIKLVNEKTDEIVLYKFIILVSRLGYKSERIYSLVQRSPNREIVRSVLLKARKPAYYKYNKTVFEDYIK